MWPPFVSKPDSSSAETVRLPTGPVPTGGVKAVFFPLVTGCLSDAFGPLILALDQQEMV